MASLHGSLSILYLLVALVTRSAVRQITDYHIMTYMRVDRIALAFLDFKISIQQIILILNFIKWK